MNAPRHAWLIGASSGIGLEVGRLLVADGWRVTLSARDTERLQDAAEEIAARAEALDVTDADSVFACATRVFADTPPCLVLINAGDYEPMPIEAFDVALFERLNRVNYLGPVNVLAAVLPRMRGTGGQCLITASASGYVGLPRAAPYSAPKAAAIHLAQALAPEAAHWGVRLRVINPGFVRSRLTAKNRFRMPGLMEPIDAARRIVARIDDRGFEISFPRRLVWPLKLLRCLPQALHLWLMQRYVLGSGR
ncbi:MAG: SDR family NAD(P)-dependent oxidoreductase [Gammaproteobacteria bacterium]|nr:SDR family NAD(P)-dependent oxidoreductase [Gammaproteobacteria bacterium]